MIPYKQSSSRSISSPPNSLRVIISDELKLSWDSWYMDVPPASNTEILIH